MATTTPTTKTTAKAAAPRNFGEYDDLLTGLRVARGEQARLARLLDEIAGWVAGENSSCYHVAVYTGRVRGPLAFEAIKHTRHRREGRVMRLLPEREIYGARRMDVDDPILAVKTAARMVFQRAGEEEERHRHERRYELFRRPE
jgi:hypothetical protein